MRRLIRADIRRILKKRSVIVLFFIALAFLCFHVIGSFLAYEKDPLVPVKSLMAHMSTPTIKADFFMRLSKTNMRITSKTIRGDFLTKTLPKQKAIAPTITDSQVRKRAGIQKEAILPQT